MRFSFSNALWPKPRALGAVTSVHCATSSGYRLPRSQSACVKWASQGADQTKSLDYSVRVALVFNRGLGESVVAVTLHVPPTEYVESARGLVIRFERRDSSTATLTSATRRCAVAPLGPRRGSLIYMPFSALEGVLVSLP